MVKEGLRVASVSRAISVGRRWLVVRENIEQPTRLGVKSPKAIRRTQAASFTGCQPVVSVVCKGLTMAVVDVGDEA